MRRRHGGGRRGRARGATEGGEGALAPAHGDDRGRAAGDAGGLCLPSQHLVACPQRRRHSQPRRPHQPDSSFFSFLPRLFFWGFLLLCSFECALQYEARQ
eukprot:2381867-Rhodomonas_salina.1